MACADMMASFQKATPSGRATQEGHRNGFGQTAESRTDAYQSLHFEPHAVFCSPMEFVEHEDEEDGGGGGGRGGWEGLGWVEDTSVVRRLEAAPLSKQQIFAREGGKMGDG